ncbi:MAG TPA: ribonuclease domain-containing protein [Casimicrobiaceae bacterium]|nr:ribonuclease domain-containing protein [Casimicrobiaceae bacterium]
MSPSSARLRGGLVAIIAALITLVASTTVAARASQSDLPVIAASDLPREAREVLERVHSGGPFAYERDGVVFGNREQVLPPRRRGYYHEYTVPTPGERTRGARRIVCGGPARLPDACFYSNDHYRTFARIRE